MAVAAVTAAAVCFCPQGARASKGNENTIRRLDGAVTGCVRCPVTAWRPLSGRRHHRAHRGRRNN